MKNTVRNLLIRFAAVVILAFILNVSGMHVLAILGLIIGIVWLVIKLFDELEENGE